MDQVAQRSRPRTSRSVVGSSTSEPEDHLVQFLPGRTKLFLGLLDPAFGMGNYFTPRLERGWALGHDANACKECFRDISFIGDGRAVHVDRAVRNRFDSAPTSVDRLLQVGGYPLELHILSQKYEC